MIIVNTHEAKTKLSKLLQKIEINHETVRICRNGKPVADLVPISYTHDRLKKHAKICNVKIDYDPTEPLAEENWPDIQN